MPFPSLVSQRESCLRSGQLWHRRDWEKLYKSVGLTDRSVGGDDGEVEWMCTEGERLATSCDLGVNLIQALLTSINLFMCICVKQNINGNLYSLH